MPSSEIPADLLASYRAADYRVHTGEATFRLRIDQRSEDLARLLADTGQPCALFITAHNPLGEPRDAVPNEAANLRLHAELTQQASALFEAAGHDPRGAWAAEPSFLALGVGLEASRALGRAHGQNAVVWAGEDAVPRLILLR